MPKPQITGHARMQQFGNKINYSFEFVTQLVRNLGHYFLILLENFVFGDVLNLGWKGNQIIKCLY